MAKKKKKNNNKEFELDCMLRMYILLGGSNNNICSSSNNHTVIYHFELKGVQGVLVNVIVTKEDKDTLLKQLFHIILTSPIVAFCDNPETL